MPDSLQIILNNIVDLMGQLDISQSDLAKSIGMPQPQLSGYLSGKNQPGIDKLERIAAGLNTTLAALLGATPSAIRTPTKAELALMVLESFNLEERQINVCRLALTAKPDLLKAMHDSLLRPAFEAIKGIAADHDDSSVG